MHSLQLGPLTIHFHRTVRVDPDKTSNLPPSLGHFEIYKVSDFKDQCPADWEPEGYFLAMHDKEAMWLSFSTEENEPVALLVGAGGINAVTGDKLGIKLAKDNYLVTPPQPWLDGWKGEDGSVFQFVTTEYKAGKGLTVGEQIMGEECKTGGMGFVVYTAKDRETLKAKSKPREVWGDSDDSTLDYDKEECNYAKGLKLCSFAAPVPASTRPKRDRAIAGGQSVNRVACSEVGVGKGGKITQKIYPDPHGLEVWKTSPDRMMAVYLIDGVSFTQITGKPMPPMPKDVMDYIGKWYGLHDKEEKDVAGTDKFTGLATVFHTKEVQTQSDAQETTT
jgi:hypothetical protein